MINPVFASGVLAVIALFVIASQRYFARLQRKEEAEEIAAQRERYVESARVRWEQALPSLQLPEWKPWQPGANESEERPDAPENDPKLELTLAQLWENASRETDDR